MGRQPATPTRGRAKTPVVRLLCYTESMSQPLVSLSQHILNHLSAGESRVLSLVVAVRKTLGREDRIKGDLSEAVRLSLQKLVAAQTVTEADGMFSLAPTRHPSGFRRPTTATPASSPPAAGEDW